MLPTKNAGSDNIAYRILWSAARCTSVIKQPFLLPVPFQNSNRVGSLWVHLVNRIALDVRIRKICPSKFTDRIPINPSSETGTVGPVRSQIEPTGRMIVVTSVLEVRCQRSDSLRDFAEHSILILSHDIARYCPVIP